MSQVQFFQHLTFGDAIRAKRGDMPLRECADMIGAISASTLSRLESKEQLIMPAMESFLRICGWLNRPITDFIGNSPHELSPEMAELVRQKRIQCIIWKDEAEALQGQARSLETVITTAIKIYHGGKEASHKAAYSYLASHPNQSK